MDDRDLFERIQKNKSVFSKLYERYVDKIYRYVYFATNNSKETAEDITSQVFMKLLERIEYIELKEQYEFSVLPYLYTIARNLVYKSYKDSSNKVSLPEDDEISVSFSMDSTPQLISECSTERILALISKVDLLAKDIVYLKVCEDMTFDEIAEKLELGKSAVKMKYYRTLGVVSKLLTEDKQNGK
jgi:RNA polymerase sigma-70 factor (ECF subfamily)